jgi:hypothetical protein
MSALQELSRGQGTSRQFPLINSDIFARKSFNIIVSIPLLSLPRLRKAPVTIPRFDATAATIMSQIDRNRDEATR